MYFTIYETYITCNIFIKSNFIFAAVHAVQPENTAVNKSAWTTTNDTTAPPNWAVDGNPATFTRIFTPSWPFLAVDLGHDSTLKTVVLRVWNGECLNVCMYIYIYIFILNTYVYIYIYIKYENYKENMLVEVGWRAKIWWGGAGWGWGGDGDSQFWFFSRYDWIVWIASFQFGSVNGIVLMV